ncbi:MAG: serine/threonine-protein kinase [Candidatus Eisenbacteria bacterium]
MSGGPRRDIDEILEQAAQLALTARERFLRDSCEGDDALLSELLSLLEVLDDSRGFLETGENSSQLQVIGPYTLGRVLGAGGMGTVYLGERSDGEFERKVAVKLIHSGLPTPDILRRFHREKRVLARLDHPNIARLLDGGATPEGRPYLIMEYVEGEPIDRYCDARRLSIRDRVSLVRSVGFAVDHAHHQNVVHRDIKPANVLVDRRGAPKLLDFGIAKVMASTDQADETHTGFQRLTPRYASPEQVLHLDVTPASDVYSLGVLLYELLTGAGPYDADGAALELSDAVVRSAPVRPSVRAARASAHVLVARREKSSASLADSMRGDLEHVVLQALAKDPEDRYPTAADFAQDLSRWLDSEQVEARPETFTSRARRFLKRHPLTAYFREGRARRESQGQRQLAETIAGLLQDVLSSVDPTLAQGRDIELLRSVLDVTAKRVNLELDPDTLIAARLHTTIGTAYHAIGAYDAAEAHLGSGLEARRRAGAGPLELAQSHLYLGGTCRELSRYPEAIDHFRRTLAILEQLSPPDRGQEALARDHLGRALEILGQDEEAERELRAAIEIGTEALGRENLDVIRFVGSLARFLTTRERPEEAGELAEDSVARARLVGDEPSLSMALVTHGFYLNWVRAFEEAEPVYREGLALRVKIYGENHPFVANTQVDLATVLESLGRFDEAESLYLRALETNRACSGARSLDVGTKLNNIGGLMRKVGRLEEANAYLEEALSIYREQFGDSHLWVVIARMNLGATLLARAEFARAEAELAEAESRIDGRWEDDYWRVQVLRSLRGAALARLDRKAEARPLLEAAAESLTRSLGEGDDRADSARRRWQEFVAEEQLS